MLNDSVKPDTKARRQSVARRTAMGVLAIGPFALGLGILVIVLFCVHATKLDNFFPLFGTLVLVALASVVTGGFIGFIFGIPKITPNSTDQTAKSEQPKQASADTARDVAEIPTADLKSQGARPAESQNSSHHVNTNLEEVSDWLTKIIVGISLVEFKEIVGLVGEISKKIETAFKPVCTKDATNCFVGVDVFSGAEIIFFFIIGVHFGYLWTRLLVQGAIKDADLSLVGHLEETVEQQRDDISARQRQEQANKTALETINKVLQESSFSIAQGELKRMIGNATTDIRSTIFYRARDFRQNYTRTNPELLKRAVSIFKALIKLDEEESAGNPLFHRNYSQLGYVLKDKHHPDYEGAIVALTDAIKIRPSALNKYYAIYEYNRAHCLIKTDENFAAQKPADDEGFKNKVVNDLTAASQNTWIEKDVISSDKIIEKWLKLNKISLN